MTTGAWPEGLARGWHPIAYIRELGSAPTRACLMDRALVVFRTKDGVAVLDDRCPHRNAPLSSGRVIAREIECPYHGWRFDGAGRCTRIAGSVTVPSAQATAWPVRLHAGLVWTTLANDPAPFPALPLQIDDDGYHSFWWRLPPSRGAIGDAIENLLDPVHAYFLHPGLVRRSRDPVPVVIDFVIEGGICAANYTEPSRGMTWLQRLTEGRRTSSSGRYTAPTIVQIGFSDARGLTATITVIFAPVGAGATRPYARFSTRRGLAPAWLKRAFIIAFHRRVLDQDLRMLRLQSRVHARFGGPRYAHGPLDMFGPAIWAGLNGQPMQPERRRLHLGGAD